MGLFISAAVAAEPVTAAATEAAPAAQQGAGIGSTVVMLVAFIAIFYFMILRPQQKRTREHRQLMDSIAKDDEVLTNGGLVGKVVKVNDTGYLVLALNDQTEVTIKRDFVTAVLPKGTLKAI